MANKLLSTFKNFWGFEEAEEEEEEVIEEKVVKETQAPVYTPASTSFFTPQSKNRVVNIHSNANMKIEVFQPQTFEAAVEIVECLRAKKPVIINLEAIPSDLARKIFDFLSGALCAIDGKAEKISRGIFLLAPTNVEINGKITSEGTVNTDENLIESTFFQFK